MNIFDGIKEGEGGRIDIRTIIKIEEIIYLKNNNMLYQILWGEELVINQINQKYMIKCQLQITTSNVNVI